MMSTSYFEGLERESAVLNAHGLSCPPSQAELADMLCELSDKLDTLAKAEGWSFKCDYRGRWYVLPSRDAS